MNYVGVGVTLTAILLVVSTHGIVMVAGGSMSPALEVGDVCLYRREAKPRAGDVVVFTREDGSLVAHRAVSVGRRGEVRTKGDACEAADRDPVPANRVKGRVVWSTGMVREQVIGALSYATLRIQSHSVWR
ncbi:MAG: signal peptidase I [Clostridiales bacterium]|nr:signal peptidase I [Clostridiales bacterium]